MLAFIHAKLFDGTGRPPVDNAAVLVEGGRITRVGVGGVRPEGGGRRRPEGEISHAGLFGGAYPLRRQRPADEAGPGRQKNDTYDLCREQRRVSRVGA